MKNVYIPVGDRGLGPELQEQLRIFGITIFEVDSIEEISRLSITHGSGVAVVDQGRMDRDPSFVTELHALKDRLGPRLRLIYYADRDDFELRLKAVRAGAEAFFQMPVDASLLSEKLDAFFMDREARPYRVLIVDDDPTQAEYHSLVLREAGMEPTVATDPRLVIPLLVEEGTEIILMDMYMPGCTGQELAAIVRQNEAFTSLPIIFLSVERDLEKQIGAIKQGGDAFLEKPIKPDHLVANVAIRAEKTRAFRYFMERDSLTGLLTHTHLSERLANELLRARRSGSLLSFATIDIDGFKAVNERFGHLAGDRIIKILSRILSERLRRTDIVGRTGGEEFGIVLPETDGPRAARILDELRESFGRLRHRHEEREFSVTFSCGIASYPEQVGPGELIEAAERALRRAKASGRDRVVS